MNINRNNYEEYFLMYADKELSAAEKAMVENFVQQNPDLEEELIMLQQSVVKPDNIVLEDKSFLYKEEGFINTRNYEEIFVLYNDDELNPSGKEETENFILENPLLKKEFELLQQIKYQPETSVVFPNKKVLYKKEENVKVIPMWWKAMAAAVLAGAGLWIGINYQQRNNIEPPVAKMTVKQENKSIITPKIISVPAPEVNLADNAKPKQSSAEKEIIEKVKTSKKEALAVSNVNQKINNPDYAKHIESPQQDLAVNEPGNIDDNKIKTYPVLEKPVTNIAEQPNKTVTNVSSAQNNYAQTASYINEEETKSDNYVFYNITQEEFKKSKVGIFLKRIKRTIERKNPLREKTFKVSSIETTPAN